MDKYLMIIEEIKKSLKELEEEKNSTIEKLSLLNSINEELIQIENKIEELKLEKKTLINAPKIFDKHKFSMQKGIVISNLISMFLLAIVLISILGSSAILAIIALIGSVLLAFDAYFIAKYFINTASLRKLVKSKTIEQVDSKISKEETKRKKYLEELLLMETDSKELEAIITYCGKLIKKKTAKLQRIDSARSEAIKSLESERNLVEFPDEEIAERTSRVLLRD